jgi:NMD protein affecting ribosome stability and mRNA decay
VHRCPGCGKPRLLGAAALCPDCTLEHRRQTDEAERLARIAAAAPPVSSFEGRVQQWRDTKDDELEVVWNGAKGARS